MYYNILFLFFFLFLGLIATISEYPGNSWACKWYPSTHYIKHHHCSQTSWRWSLLFSSWNQMWQGEKFLRSTIANIISIKRQGKMETENYAEDCNPNWSLILIKCWMSQPLLRVKKGTKRFAHQAFYLLKWGGILNLVPLAPSCTIRYQVEW